LSRKETSGKRDERMLREFFKGINWWIVLGVFLTLKIIEKIFGDKIVLNFLIVILIWGFLFFIEGFVKEYLKIRRK